MSKMIAEAGLREQGSCMTCTVGTAPEEVCRFFEAPETAEFVIIQHIRRTEKDMLNDRKLGAACGAFKNPQPPPAPAPLGHRGPFAVRPPRSC